MGEYIITIMNGGEECVFRLDPWDTEIVLKLCEKLDHSSTDLELLALTDRAEANEQILKKLLRGISAGTPTHVAAQLLEHLEVRETNDED